MHHRSYCVRKSLKIHLQHFFFLFIVNFQIFHRIRWIYACILYIGDMDRTGYNDRKLWLDFQIKIYSKNEAPHAFKCVDYKMHSACHRKQWTHHSNAIKYIHLSYLSSISNNIHKIFAMHLWQCIFSDWASEWDGEIKNVKNGNWTIGNWTWMRLRVGGLINFYFIFQAINAAYKICNCKNGRRFLFDSLCLIFYEYCSG